MLYLEAGRPPTPGLRLPGLSLLCLCLQLHEGLHCRHHGHHCCHHLVDVGQHLCHLRSYWPWTWRQLWPLGYRLLGSGWFGQGSWKNRFLVSSLLLVLLILLLILLFILLISPCVGEVDEGAVLLQALPRLCQRAVTDLGVIEVASFVLTTSRSLLYILMALFGVKKWAVFPISAIFGAQ